MPPIRDDIVTKEIAAQQVHPLIQILVSATVRHNDCSRTCVRTTHRSPPTHQVLPCFLFRNSKNRACALASVTMRANTSNGSAYLLRPVAVGGGNITGPQASKIGHIISVENATAEGYWLKKSQLELPMREWSDARWSGM